MSKKAFEVLFAAGSPQRRSSLWRAWGSLAGDVYLVNCESDSDFKLSLHPSGRCHFSCSTEQSLRDAMSGTHPRFIIEKLPPPFTGSRSDGYGRFEDVWAPKEIADDLVMPFRLGLPESELRPLRSQVLGDREVIWLPQPGSRRAIEVSFMIAGKKVPRDTVPGGGSMGSRLLHRHVYGPERMLLILWREYALTAEEQMWIPAYRPSIMGVSEHVKASMDKYDYHRAVVMIRDEAYQSRAFLDTAFE